MQGGERGAAADMMPASIAGGEGQKLRIRLLGGDLTQGNRLRRAWRVSAAQVIGADPQSGQLGQVQSRRVRLLRSPRCGSARAPRHERVRAGGSSEREMSACDVTGSHRLGRAAGEGTGGAGRGAAGTALRSASGAERRGPVGQLERPTGVNRVRIDELEAVGHGAAEVQGGDGRPIVAVSQSCRRDGPQRVPRAHL